MNRRMIAATVGILLVIALWRMLPSRNETGSSTISSWLPNRTKQNADPNEQKSQRETSSVGPAVPIARPVAAEEALRSRSEALAAFERKRRAQGQQNAADLPAPMDAYRDLPLTDPHKINGSEYQILGARAVPREQYSVSMGKILVEQNGFAVVELGAPAIGSEEWKSLIWRELDRPVVVNPANGKLAIVTGTLVVKLKDISTAAQVAARENLQILSTDESIQTVYLRPPANYLLLAGRDRLSRDPAVERVEIELYQSRKEAK